MRKKTKDLLHENYGIAITKANDILGIVENLYDLLADFSGIPAVDAPQFDSFLRGLYTSKMIRRQTFQITNLVIDLATTIMHIIIWLNSTKEDMHILADVTGRRKALETELAKLLEKPVIHDRFGIRTILSSSNSHCNEEDEKLLFEVSNYVIDILTQKNRKLRSNFLSWILKTKGLDSLAVQKIQYILNLPFNVDLDLYKDYVSEPKDSSYQSLHWVISLESFSKVLPGTEIEFQFRTHAMHNNTINGPASEYEKKRRPETKGIFCVDDFSKVKITGFYSYEKKDDDMDGIHFPKQILSRRVSPTLIYLD